MVIKYELTKDDLKKAYKKSAKSIAKKSSIAYKLLLVGYILFELRYLKAMSDFYRIGYLNYVVPIAVVVISIFLANILNSKKVNKMIDDIIISKAEFEEGFYEEKTLEIVENSIITKSNNYYNKFSIDKIKNIFEVDDVIVICGFDNESPTIVVPTRVFEKIEDKNIFLNKIKK